MAHGSIVGSLVGQCRPTLQMAQLPEGPRQGFCPGASRWATFWSAIHWSLQRMLLFHRTEFEKQGCGRILAVPQPLVTVISFYSFWWGSSCVAPLFQFVFSLWLRKLYTFRYVLRSSGDPSVWSIYLFTFFAHLQGVYFFSWSIVVIQSLSHVRLFAIPWTAAHQASLSFTVSRSLLKLMLIDLVKPSNHLILCHPLLILPSILPSIGVFPNDLALGIRWPKYWSFSFSLSPSNEYSGLISFRVDWFDLLAVQGTLKSFENWNTLDF